MSEGYFKEKEPREFRWRIYGAAVFAGLILFGLAARFWYLQIIEGPFYADLSKNNRTRTVKSPAPRGLIYDRRGVKLAENRPGFDLYLVPEDVTDWAATKAMLKKVSGLEPEVIDEKLVKARGRPPFRAVKLKEDLSWEETVKIESYKFETPGVILDVTPKRAYLFGQATAHLIGYLGEPDTEELKSLARKGYDYGDLIGKYGIEKSYEDYIRGVAGVKKLEVDALGRKIKSVGWTPPLPGNDITLTIDMRAQRAAWEAMKDRVGAVVVLEPTTGRVLALVSSPSFDPGKLSSGISDREWSELLNNPFKVLTNRATQGQYPPASTFKPILAAAALDSGTIKPAEEIFSGPFFRFAGRDYRDWRPEGHGKINVRRAIMESSDTFFYQVGLRVGVDRIAEYAGRMGLGRKTGIELPGEKAGLVPDSGWKKRVRGERWYEGETISVSVGQGFMLTTPLQLARAYAAIANGGTLYRPALVEEIRSPAGRIIKRFVPERTGSAGISKAVLRRIREALRDVVRSSDGTAHYLERTGLRIAGKTGTAQVMKMRERIRDIKKIPYKYRDHAWFVGFAPYEDPKIVVAVMVEHGGFGAVAAAPIAAKVMKAYLGEGAVRKPKRKIKKPAEKTLEAGPAREPEKVTSVPDRAGSEDSEKAGADNDAYREAETAKTAPETAGEATEPAAADVAIKPSGTKIETAENPETRLVEKTAVARETATETSDTQPETEGTAEAEPPRAEAPGGTDED